MIGDADRCLCGHGKAVHRHRQYHGFVECETCPCRKYEAADRPAPTERAVDERRETR